MLRLRNADVMMTHRALGLILQYMSNYESEGYFRWRKKWRQRRACV